MGTSFGLQFLEPVENVQRTFNTARCIRCVHGCPVIKVDAFQMDACSHGVCVRRLSKNVQNRGSRGTARGKDGYSTPENNINSPSPENRRCRRKGKLERRVDESVGNFYTPEKRTVFFMYLR